MCFHLTCGEGSVWKVLPTCTAQMWPTRQGSGVVTLLSSMGTGGKGHNGCTSYSSSGVLIKEDEQKTIAGSLLPESQILECRLKAVSRGWNVWALVRGGG